MGNGGVERIAGGGKMIVAEMERMRNGADATQRGRETERIRNTADVKRSGCETEGKRNRAEARSAGTGTGPVVPFAKIGVCLCVCVCVPHLLLQSDKWPVGDGWQVEFEF